MQPGTRNIYFFYITTRKVYIDYSRNKKKEFDYISNRNISLFIYPIIKKNKWILIKKQTIKINSNK